MTFPTARRAPLARTTLALLALATVLSACAGKAPRVLPPEPGAAMSTSGAANAGGTDSRGLVPGSQGDFQATLMGRDVIYFNTDKYAIDAEATTALQSQAQWLMRYPAKHATLEGHTDERGTRDYNLALGERRANAAKVYLQSLGVDGTRLNTVSYGKERPAAVGSSEDAWAKNRRAVTVVVD